MNIQVLENILGEVDKKISESDVKLVLEKIFAGQSLEEALKKENIDLESEIKKLIQEKPGLSSGAYMGLAMAKFKGKVSGKDVSDVLKKILG